MLVLFNHRFPQLSYTMLSIITVALAGCEAIVVSLTSSVSDWLDVSEVPSSSITFLCKINVFLYYFHILDNRLIDILTFCECCMCRRTLWTSGLLSNVDDWLDGGCEYSDVFSSSDARTPSTVVGVCLNLLILQPGPMGLLAILEVVTS